jgi:Na+/H+ antiporter NhaD/arsenite permease-like protein
MLTSKRLHRTALALALGAIAVPGVAQASTGAAAATEPALLGLPVSFILFGLTLLGVALFHHKTMQVALTGLTVIIVYKLLFVGFGHAGPGLPGLLRHVEHEWVILVNLLGLLLGFALLANHFEESEVPLELPRFLPDDWRGGFLLLCMVFVLSSFLDNIAGALIGGAMAHSVFNKRVHLGYLAAIVAASNAGGSGSVVGDTTTTMMWIHHISPGAVDHAYVAAAVALVVFGIPASIQQQKYSPIMKDEPSGTRVDWARVFIVGLILVAAIVTNVIVNLKFPEHSDSFPFIGAAVWAAILVTVPLRKPDWKLLPAALRGSTFLLSLVLAATMMPVERLPDASWRTAFGLGFLSAVFDNIPLTALALKQGGYDWGMLAYTVGFGGSMVWFGSSAGVALSNMFPEAKSVGGWLKNGWHVTLAYILGFFVLLATLGWRPTPEDVGRQLAPAVPATTAVATAATADG